ncbi:unnamed protein product [Eruca vesicaria subsp. sativa]|uniref:Uncharacterized protein n=1 Tax=Eruca vesicaria subsp. sativa TaxID=29727 RepID=A0ABC8M0M1_ERUVS|nr:unnamed protein product [Eruca vesicaria subsp. sativa]
MRGEERQTDRELTCGDGDEGDGSDGGEERLLCILQSPRLVKIRGEREREMVGGGGGWEREMAGGGGGGERERWRVVVVVVREREREMAAGGGERRER